jgi:hypothetical protein
MCGDARVDARVFRVRAADEFARAPAEVVWKECGVGCPAYQLKLHVSEVLPQLRCLLPQQRSLNRALIEA